MSQRVFCEFCTQEFFSDTVEQCPLCGNVGGLIPIAVVTATPAPVSDTPRSDSFVETADAPPTTVFVQDPSAFRFVRWTWRQLLVALLPLLAFHTVLRFISRGALREAPGIYIAALFFTEMWCLLFPLWLTLRANPSTDSLFRSRRRLVIEAIWAIPLTIAFFLLISGLLMLMYWLFGDAGLTEDVTEGMRRSPEVTPVLLAVVVVGSTIGPLAEEVFFRGMLYNMLRQRWHFLFALPTQAGIFALLHFQPLMNFIYLFTAGILLALVYEWRRTLWAPALIHVAFNSIVFGYVLISVINNANAPVLGVACEDRQNDTGCVVKTVVPGSAAEQAGLQVGDVIVGLNGEGIWDFRHLTDLIRSREVGETVTVQFYRGEVLYELTARLQRRQSKSDVKRVPN